MTEPHLGELIFDDLDPALLMQRIVDEAHALVGSCDGAAIMRCHGEALETVSAAGVTARHVGRSIPMRTSLSGLAIARGELQYSDDMTVDARVSPEIRADPLARSLLSVPLRRGEEVIGVLVIVSRRLAAFDADVRANVERVASVVGVALASVIDTARAVRSVFQAIEAVPALNAAAASATGAAARATGAAAGATGATAGSETRVGEFLANVIKPGSLEDLRSRQRVGAVLEHGRLRMVAQPVVELETGRVVGVEALARFPGTPSRAPDIWFREAAVVGLGLELEELAIRRALGMLDTLPGGLELGLNVSHELLLSGRLERLLEGHPSRRLLIELTEHAAFEDYAAFRDAMAPLRERGIRLAVDDVGAGFSSLRHVIELAPDRIKLDRLFTSGIDSDPARRAMAEALVGFAGRTGIGLVAEGIETKCELDVMRRLGVPLGQGFLIQRPTEPRAIPRLVEHILPVAEPLLPGADRMLARCSARVGRSLRRERMPATVRS
ncbi:MAG TPA: EAL domain-containing protein [Solirubrobacteraceae bacterium]|nr:EAL domain-containing protein [Solirubrobacteraceae bacterium]